MVLQYLKKIDIFKVEHNFLMFRDQKSVGKKNYDFYYGSYAGAIITIILGSMAFVYFLDLLIMMASGSKDTIDLKEFPNDFNGTYASYNYSENNDTIFDP